MIWRTYLITYASNSLEHPIPIPAYHPSPLPLHGFLTHPPSSHIISLSLRNLHDNQNMPANTNIFVQARTVRGVRKVGIDDWITWCKALRPDLVWALVDAPKTLTGMGDPDSETPDTGEVIPGEGRQTSQKRTMKSMDRSWLWVEKLVRDLTLSTGPSERLQGAISTIQSRPPIIVPLVGGCDPRARAEFSRGLVDKLDVPIVQSDDVALKRIEEGIIGYAIELVDLPSNALITPPSTTSTRSSSQDENNPEEPNAMLELLRASFDPLDNNKLRIAHSAPSPHVILRLIGEAGMDLFESPWLAEAADLGISLNFQFPAPVRATQQGMSISIGQNLFEEHFSMDFEPIGELDSSWPCHPMYSNHHTLHGRLDSEQWKEDVSGKKSAFEGFTRAYVHHLLHTHEMGAYALLHLHNLAVMDRFFEGIRSYMSQNADSIDFTKEVLRFYETYDLPGPLFDEARRRWKEVEDARGKGSLKREREVLNNVQGAEGVPVFAVDDANPRIGMPKSDATAVLEEAIEDRV